MWRRFYHVTHAKNASSIIDNGIVADYSRGKIRCVWLVDSKRVAWAIAHVSSKHDWPIKELWVFAVHVDPRVIIKTAWRGVYKTVINVPVYEIYTASGVINRGPIRLVESRG
jgi:hypothetical protein